MELDPNEYGDVERFIGLAREVTPRVSTLDVLVLTECSAEALAMELDRWQRGDVQAKLQACSRFYVDYVGVPEAEAFGNEVATKAQIAESVARLLHAYPTSRINDPAAYFRLLVDEIYSATSANRVVVELALRSLRRTFKTPPAVATIIEAVKKHEEEWMDVCFLGFDGFADRAKAKLAKLQASAAQADDAHA